MIPTSLAGAIFWAALLACAVAQLAIVRSVLTGLGARRPLEIAWAVAPAFALALVLFATWRTMHPRTAESSRAGGGHAFAVAKR